MSPWLVRPPPASGRGDQGLGPKNLGTAQRNDDSYGQSHRAGEAAKALVG